MNYETILFNVKDSVAKITLNRPDAHNSVDLQMSKELMYAALECSEDPAVRAILLAASGKAFSAGGDLKAFAGAGNDLPQVLKEITTYLHAAVSRLARLDAPLIVAVNGVAAGAGMSLACAGDIVLAAQSASFIMAYTRMGLTPDGSSSYFLPRIVGLRQALELALTNRELSVKEAFDLGIVTRVVPDEDLAEQANTLAAQLAAGATKAFGSVKRLLYRSWTETLETQMENEAQSIAAMAHTLDAREALAAFVEKRTPKLQGK